MRFAVQRLLVTFDIEHGLFHAGGMSATPGIDIDHALLSVVLAQHRRLATLDIVVGRLCAGISRAALPENVHHTLFSMLPAIHRWLDTFDVKPRILLAVSM